MWISIDVSNIQLKLIIDFEIKDDKLLFTDLHKLKAQGWRCVEQWKFIILLFKSLRNSKRRNKGNLTSKSNSNKIKLCGGGGQHYLVLDKISTL